MDVFITGDIVVVTSRGDLGFTETTSVFVEERLLPSSLSVFVAGAVVTGQGVSNAHCDVVSVVSESITPSELSQESTVRSRTVTALSEVSTVVTGAERYQFKVTGKREGT